MRVRMPFLRAAQSRLRPPGAATRRRILPAVLSVVGLTAVLGLAIYAGAMFGGTQLARAATLQSADATGSAASTPTPAPPVAKGTITIVTFGYKFGRAPKGCRFLADVRNINAGTFSPRQNGLMASVRNRVMRTAAAKRWHRLFLTKWLPKLKAGDKVAIGCSRGHHRSVALAYVFAQDLRASGYTVKLVNRDIKKKY